MWMHIGIYKSSHHIPSLAIKHNIILRFDINPRHKVRFYDFTTCQWFQNVLRVGNTSHSKTDVKLTSWVIILRSSSVITRVNRNWMCASHACCPSRNIKIADIMENIFRFGYWNWKIVIVYNDDKKYLLFSSIKSYYAQYTYI